jgi:hypothetical protein
VPAKDDILEYGVGGVAACWPISTVAILVLSRFQAGLSCSDLALGVMIFIEQDLIPKKDRGAYNHV